MYCVASRYLTATSNIKLFFASYHFHHQMLGQNLLIQSIENSYSAKHSSKLTKAKRIYKAYKALKFCWWRQLIKRTLLCQFSLKFLPCGQWAMKIGSKPAANLKVDGLESMQDASQSFLDLAINCEGVCQN